MQREYNFAVEEIKRIEFSDYDEQEFSIARLGFISTRPNSHGIGIDEDCLRASAPSALGMWIVAKMFMGDATTHEDDEHIVGMIPKDQDIEFVEDDDGYLRAYCDAIISKRYAADFCEIFENDNERAVSIEAKFTMKPDDENEAESFSVKGVTVLGKRVKPSCPESDIAFVRFSESDAEDYYRACHGDAVSNLTKFVETRKQSMAEKKYVSHPINTSKDAVYTGEWDGNKARQDLIKEKNYKSLAPKVCLKLEEGWEDREVTKLGYPVMGLYDGEWRYSTKAIASAQAYAEQNDETEVLNKIKDIRKKLDLDDTDGKEEKMSMEIEFAAVNIGDLWGRLWHEIDETRHWEYSIEGIYEEDNKKFAVLRDRAQKLYRLDFSLTEDGMTVADEVVEVKQEFTETDNVKKFAEPENVADYRFADEDDDDETKMSEDEMMAKIAQLEKDIEERDNIIMERDTELADLREYKKAVMAKENACAVEAIMAEIKPFVNDEQFAAFREEGLACDETNFDAWSNKVKAVCFSEVKKSAKKDDMGVFSFAAPIDVKKIKSTSVWDRL